MKMVREQRKTEGNLRQNQKGLDSENKYEWVKKKKKKAFQKPSKNRGRNKNSERYGMVLQPKVSLTATFTKGKTEKSGGHPPPKPLNHHGKIYIKKRRELEGNRGKGGFPRTFLLENGPAKHFSTGGILRTLG